MAYSTGRQQCALDENCKQAAVYNCRGCFKAFCSTHVTDHRSKLSMELNEIISEHDDLKNIFTQHSSNPSLHPLLKQIDEWEKESIEKIHLKAKELREELLQPINVQINELSKRLEPLSEQLIKGREMNDFIEIDLNHWKQIFDLIKSDLFSPLKFAINQDDKNPLIENRSIILKTMNERFESVFDNTIRIEEDGEVVIHDGPSGHKEIRGKNEYSTGCHRIRLRMETIFTANTFLGINSRATTLQSQSFSSKSAYLWYNSNRIYSNGTSQSNNSNSPIEMNTNDVITLIFDCDNRKISMINERTNAKHELTINIDNCPFPWQLHVNMYSTKCRIRILPQ